ncbi:3-hydroxyacyl-CoA dehydrogenase family protein [Haloprofundus sp. MHR1]|uniref:3-hydroxyacyl-CoA dehydrogenase family protein n=1 Tax=Haloprofundus sp. MHR1 TaxID=2572921 RepID=UPI0010BE7DAA|nr:3-hydroxyacyl-CoA dehydrogenase family protein [Haloprofundus sp. MHR1]QCJ48424.1 3-hydroxyacyl-CoA dehydrogenase family protein [Haloprofundus sp. MHR1]
MNVCVIGAGTMGHGIAQVSAMGGHDVTLRDIEDGLVADGLAAIEANLDGGVERGKVSEDEREATLARLDGTTDLAEAVADAGLVVEAVPEDEELKKQVLSDVSDHAPADAVLATNTSSLPVTSIASALDEPSRCVGLHFFNPPHIMQLVEVVLAEQTSVETREFAESFVDGVGRTAVVVEDAPGFATSRLGVALGVEAVRMVESGVASPRDIDAAMELGYNHPMGPLELGDVVGLDVRLDILEHLREELGERFRPPSLLRKKVRAGKLGKKTGEGFYVWEDGEIVGVSGENDA